MLIRIRLSVPSQMGRVCPYFFEHTQKLTEFFYCSGLKIWTLITINLLRDVIVDKEIVS